MHGHDAFFGLIENIGKIERIDVCQCRAVGIVRRDGQPLFAARFYGEVAVLSFGVDKPPLGDDEFFGIAARLLDIADNQRLTS